MQAHARMHTQTQHTHTNKWGGEVEKIKKHQTFAYQWPHTHKHTQTDKVQGPSGAAPENKRPNSSNVIPRRLGPHTHMFPSRDDKGNTASHRVAIIDRIYSKLFFIYVPPVLFFCFFVFPSLENADIESSFVSPLPVGDTWSICHSVLKHEIQSRDVVRAVCSLRCVDLSLRSQKGVSPAGSGRLK